MKLTNKLLIISTMIIGGSQTAVADFSLGAGIGASTEIYRQYDSSILPLPVINYESDNFYFRGLGGGYYLFKDRSDELALNAYYLPFSFKPKDSDNKQMQQLDKRNSSIMAGLSYRHIEQWGTIRTLLSADVLDNSNGVLADLGYLYNLKLDKLRLTPGVGILWASKDYNRYYFGINQYESARSGLERYTPSDSWSSYLEMNASYSIDPSWSAAINGRITRFSNEITDSPMVDKTYNLAAFASINYSF